MFNLKLTAVALILMLLCAGCRTARPAAPTSSPTPPSIKDLTVAEIRATATAQAWTVERIVAELASLDPWNARMLAAVDAHAAELTPRLRAAMREQAGQARLTAAHLLLRLGSPDGMDPFIAGLGSRSVEERSRALIALDSVSLWISSPDVPPRSPVRFDEAALAAALRPLLTDANAAPLALEIMFRLELPGAAEAARAALAAPESRAYGRALYWLAQHHDPAALEAAAKAVRDGRANDNDLYWPMSGLRDFVEKGSPAQREAAASALADFTLTAADRGDNTTSNLIWTALTGLEAARYPQEEAVLERVLASQVKDWRRGIALRRLAAIHGVGMKARLLEALHDPTLKASAAEALADTLKGTRDREALRSLQVARLGESQSGTLDALTAAYLDVGGDVAGLASQSVELNPATAMRAHWLANGIEPAAAAARLAEAGVIALPDAARLAPLKEAWRADHNALSFMFGLLSESDRLAVFDAERPEVPVDYVALADELVRISRPAFDADSFIQETNEETYDSVLRFVYRDRDYAISLAASGDWCDCATLVEGFNVALREAGQPERFVSLYTGDQMVALAFGPEEALKQTARELRLPLEEDLLAAAARGMKVEEYMREQLEGEGAAGAN